MRGKRAGSRWDLLVSPALALSVALLVVNDHVLKDRWPGVVTGKLSDIAGVAMMAIVLAALSGRPRLSVVTTAVAFALLKTVPAVASTAAPMLGGVTRTDPTDLLALIALVPVWRWLAAASPIGAPDAPRFILPLKIASLCGVVVATSATSCTTDEVYRVDAVDGMVIASTDDGIFRSLDGGRTWQPAEDAPSEVTAGDIQQSACLADGSCFEITDSSVVRTSDGVPATEFGLSSEEVDQLASSNPNDCGGGSTRLDSIAVVELADGAHVVVSVGVHGVLHRSPDGVWEWAVIGDYGEDNPLTAAGSGAGGDARTAILLAITFITPFALAHTAIPLARIARRSGRPGSTGALPVLFGAVVLLVLSPIVFIAGAFVTGGLETVPVVLIAMSAVIVFAVTLAVVGRPPGTVPSAGRPLPPPAMPAPT